MGRTNPTYRDALSAIEREWEPMGRALRREYRADFGRLFDRARGFADAAGYANPPDPERAFLLSLLLAHEVELRRLREDLRQRREDRRDRETVAGTGRNGPGVDPGAPNRESGPSAPGPGVDADRSEPEDRTGRSGPGGSCGRDGGS